MRPFLLSLLLVSSVAWAQTQGQPRIIVEHHGRVTNLRTQGALASTHTLGCIPLAQARNIDTPPDLYQGVRKCMDQGAYPRAAALFAVAGIYAAFDTERVTDKSATAARTALLIQVFAHEPAAQKMKFRTAFHELVNSREKLNALCGKVRKIGMPAYYPDYMVLYGMRAFEGDPHKGALIGGFDAARAWSKLLASYLHCPG